MKIKQYIFPIALLGFLACNTKQQSTPVTSDKQEVENGPSDTVYLVRNTEITPANSYSNLFLDSAAITRFILANNLTVDDQKWLRSFYNYRNLQFAWFSSVGFTEEARGFWNLQDQLGKKDDKWLSNKMDILLNTDTLTIRNNDTTIAKTELALTNAYLHFFTSHRNSTQFAQIPAEKAIPIKKQSLIAFTDTLIHQRTDTVNNKMSVAYQLLKQKLQLYNSIAQMGGCTAISFSGPPLTKGAAAPVITLIKRRLQQTGNMTGSDSSVVFSDSLLTAIKNYQVYNGMTPTGKISETLVQSLNVPVQARIQQIIINLTRMQWSPATPETKYLSVNIPDFRLTVFENNAKVFDMPVAVGKEGTNTTMFTGNMNQVVFSPYWNIPASIVEKELLPKMKEDENYLQSKRMEIVGKNDSLPKIRQLPGEGNMLGKVKFLFPNRYDIYLHDSPEKWVFSQARRDVSHGCIRLSNAEKLAVYLLRNNDAWPPEKVHEAMNSGEEQFVKLSPPVAVHINYYTAWVDENGQLNFRDDIYGNDSRVAQMFFNNAAQTPDLRVQDSLLKK
ncbi:MAG: L,D-transpeptidase family protein [Ferruginibacter sp.]